MDVCGDGMVGPTEACDDGDASDGDGCSAACSIEMGYVCDGAPSACANGTCAAPFPVSVFPYHLTGTDFLQFDDSGNFGLGVGCEDADGVDEGPDVVFVVDLLQGDTVSIAELGGAQVVMHVFEPSTCGPTAACVASTDGPESGGTSYTATSDGSAYLGFELELNGVFDIVVDVDPCGDGATLGDQECDDGNLVAGDGCSSSCKLEPGYECAGQPSVCTVLPAASCQAPIVVSSTPFQFADPSNLVAYGNEAVFGLGASCTDVSSTPGAGADLVFRADLAQGETVRLRELGTVNTVLHILSPGLCAEGVACVESATSPEATGISYTATAAGPVYLVVEAAGVPDPTDTLDVRIDTWICGDGVVDGTESCDDGNATSGDGCSAACDFETATAALLPTCSGTIYTYAPTVSLPVAVPDDPFAPLDLQFVVPQLGTVEKAAVRVSVSHPTTGQLDISLAGPGQALPGTDLSSDNGSGGSNYTNTIFVDGVPKTISNGVAPFTGSYEPESPLSLYAGGTALGIWNLRIDDDTPGGAGNVTFAGLALCIVP
jgi:cysteine-rich repeat protein